MAESGDEYMIEQNWVRLEKNKTALAARLRDLADEVDRISMVRHGDVRRQPIDIVAEVDHTLKWGMVNLPLGQMFTWAGAIYEARDYQNSKEV